METTHTTFHTIEHVVVPTDLSYQQVIAALEVRLGIFVDWSAAVHHIIEIPTSWERGKQFIDTVLGSSGFTIFGKVNQGAFLSLAGKPRKIVQYTLGNSLLFAQMGEQHSEVGLYAPLHLVVYEDHTGKTFVAYDRLSSLLSQYQDEGMTRTALLVDQMVAKLVDQVTQGNE